MNAYTYSLAYMAALLCSGLVLFWPVPWAEILVYAVLFSAAAMVQGRFLNWMFDNHPRYERITTGIEALLLLPLFGAAVHKLISAALAAA